MSKIKCYLVENKGRLKCAAFHKGWVFIIDKGKVESVYPKDCISLTTEKFELIPDEQIYTAILNYCVPWCINNRVCSSFIY